MSYKQLTQEERYQIYALNKAGHDQATIAGILDRNPGTISRELRRNRGLKGYRPQQAHNLALRRRYDKAPSYRQPGLAACRGTDPRGMESRANSWPGSNGTRGIYQS